MTAPCAIEYILVTRWRGQNRVCACDTRPLHPGQVMHAPPRLEPYDARIDPWNEPELAQPVTATNPEVRVQLTSEELWIQEPLLSTQWCLGQLVLSDQVLCVSPLLSLLLDSLTLVHTLRLT